MKTPLHLLLATAALMAGSTLQLRADEVSLTTALPVGEKLAFALNADVAATLTWGDGSTQTIDSDGTLQEVEVKASTLTITSSDPITSLYLQGNSLTALNVRGATRLKVLLAADNELSSLDLSQNAELTTLDVQDNQLTTLSASNAKELTSLNAARNALTRITLASAARPTTLVVNDNGMTSLPTATVLTNVTTLWAAGNKITTLPVGYATGLRSLVASANELKAVNVPYTPALREVWVDHNHLTELDLSRQSPKLQALSANDNELTIVKWDKTSKSTCKYVYLQHNALFPNSLPSLIYGGKQLSANVGDQQPYTLDKVVYDPGETIDLSALVQQNGWGISVSPTVSLKDDDGNALTAGTDYTVKNYAYTIDGVHRGLRFEVTSRQYDGLTFRTSRFAVGTTDGVSATTAATGLTVAGEKGGIRLTLAAPLRVVAVSAAGTVVADGLMTAGTHTIAVPAGIYVVNGQKVVVR